MTVNGGTTNNPIFFSDLQDAYGGTHPIFFDEYYRGDEVGTMRTVTSYAAMSNSGTGSITANGIQVIQTSVAGGTIAAGNNDLSTVASERSLGSASAGGGDFTGGLDNNAVRADSWYVRFGANRNPADYEITGATVTNDRTGESAAVGIGNSNYYQGPVWLNNDGSTPTGVTNILVPGSVNPFPGGIEAGDTFSVASCSGFRCGLAVVTAGQRTRAVTQQAATFDTTMTNQSGHTLNFTSSVGNDGNFTNGESVAASGQTSNAWSWSHPAVTATSSDANSDIPASGSIDLDEFRTVTNYTPG